MKYNTFIGVDASKLTIDAHLHLINVSKIFSNNEKGFAPLLAWVKKHGKNSDLTKAIITFEHTGMYSIKLAMYLNDVNVSFAMLPALQIKQSIGIRRGKSDQVDGQRIAECLAASGNITGNYIASQRYPQTSIAAHVKRSPSTESWRL